MNALWDTSLTIHALRRSPAFLAIDATLELTQGDLKPVVSIFTEGELKAFALYRAWGEAKRAALDALLLPGHPHR